MVSFRSPIHLRPLPSHRGQCYFEFGTEVPLFFKKKTCLFIFGCTGSSLLHTGALQLWQVGVTLRCGERASHALVAGHGLNGTQASVVAARRLSAHGTQA